MISVDKQAADITVFIGQVPDSLETIERQEKNRQVNATQLLFKVEDVATFLVENGNQITITPDSPSASFHQIRLFLLGSALGAVQHQRNRLTLHASALTNGSDAIVICGRSGAGKSTTANQLLKHGYQLISDDLAVIDFKSDGAWVMPAYPQTKVWADAAKKLNIKTERLKPVREGVDKFAYPLQKQFCSIPCKVTSVIVLEKSPINDVQKLSMTSMEKMFCLKKHTYRKKFLSFKQLRKNFKNCAELIDKVPVVKLKRPEVVNSLTDVQQFLISLTEA
ncbi:hypothetical protein [Aliikangiella sp. IMCC44359]|uniref:hypothetical protein n=1 Tax=Aliikangiella sp. IMCC44359 TaxID=3459125 RepID=UPI00403AE331